MLFEVEDDAGAVSGVKDGSLVKKIWMVRHSSK
jgi:hypothetical protein